MNKFSSQLQQKSCFQIAGIIGLNGTPQKNKFPGYKKKKVITEQHFLWEINNPNESHFLIFFHFHPIQVHLFYFQKKLLDCIT